MRGYQYWAAALVLWLWAGSGFAGTAGAGRLLDSQGAEVLHLGTNIAVRVQGLQAQVEVTQRFQNNSAPMDQRHLCLPPGGGQRRPLADHACGRAGYRR